MKPDNGVALFGEYENDVIDISHYGEIKFESLTAAELDARHARNKVV